MHSPLALAAANHQHAEGGIPCCTGYGTADGFALVLMGWKCYCRVGVVQAAVTCSGPRNTVVRGGEMKPFAESRQPREAQPVVGQAARLTFL